MADSENPLDFLSNEAGGSTLETWRCECGQVNTEIAVRCRQCSRAMPEPDLKDLVDGFGPLAPATQSSESIDVELLARVAAQCPQGTSNPNFKLDDLKKQLRPTGLFLRLQLGRLPGASLALFYGQTSKFLAYLVLIGVWLAILQLLGQIGLPLDYVAVFFVYLPWGLVFPSLFIVSFMDLQQAEEDRRAAIMRAWLIPANSFPSAEVRMRYCVEYVKNAPVDWRHVKMAVGGMVLCFLFSFITAILVSLRILG